MSRVAENGLYGLSTKGIVASDARKMLLGEGFAWKMVSRQPACVRGRLKKLSSTKSR